MSDSNQRLVIGDVRGGRNGVDPPLSLSENHLAESLNADQHNMTLARKRAGQSSVTTSSSPFTGQYYSRLFRHVPSTDPTKAELWAVDDKATPDVGRLAGGTTWTTPTFKDAPTGNGWDFSAASFNGKLFLAYNAVGALPTPGAPSGANTGVGTYAAIGRYYRIRWLIKSGTTTNSRSAVGTATALFTPSGTGTGVVVTRPALPGVGETHWELEGSADGTVWYVIFGDAGSSAAVIAATATATDNVALTTTITSFASSGSWTAPNGVGPVSYLLVGSGAGGGSGMSDDGFGAGGGGAGGEVLTGTDTIAAGAVKPIVIGAAGTGSSTQANGSDGGNVTFNSHTAHGGSGGGWTHGEGSSGTLGGGAGAISSGTGGTGTKHNGGAALFVNGGDYAGGGGAGDAAVGGSASGAAPVTPGAGGAGTASSLSGSSVTYGAGGAGAYISGGTGASGADGTGNGGAGGGSSANGGNGGKGIAVLSYGLLYGGLAMSNAAINSAGRMHLWDGSTVRRAGLAAPGVPAITNTGGGAYAATLRYYRVRVTVQSNSITIYRSEPSTSVAFTPSGAGTAARVTQGTLPGEGETHWEVEASTDNATFYKIATVVIGTTTSDDSAAVATYNTNPLSATIGMFALQKAYRYVAADQGRILGFGSYTASDPQNRLEWSAVLGDLNVSDDERCRLDVGSFQGLDENDSGTPTALIGPVSGSFFAFKDRQVWRATPTGTTTAYSVTALSKVVGAVNQQSVTLGEDRFGNPALYWMSHRGPYRYATNAFGFSQVEYIGSAIEDKTIGANGGASINLAASNVVSQTLWVPELRQVWFWFATGTSNDPDTLGVYELGRNPTVDQDPGLPDRWSIDTGPLAQSRCAVLFSNTLGAVMSRDLTPYVGSLATTNTLCKANTGTQDIATNYQASVTTKQYRPWGDGVLGSITGATLRAKATSNTCPIQLTVTRDDGIEIRTDSVDLRAVSPETAGMWVERRFGSAITVGEGRIVQFTIGDSAATNTSWSLGQLTVTWRKGAPEAA